jgi:hypothetical protein
MVAIVERQNDAGGAECIEFRVYRSPREDSDRILGAWQHATEEPFGDKTAGAIAGNMLGTPVEVEFRNVVSFADVVGIPFIWVNDPSGLFPPDRRPDV